jgi:hypothetical protein
MSARALPCPEHSCRFPRPTLNIFRRNNFVRAFWHCKVPHTALRKYVSHLYCFERRLGFQHDAADSLFRYCCQLHDSWVIVPYAFLANIPGIRSGSVTSAEVDWNNSYQSILSPYYFLVVYGPSQWPRGMSVTCQCCVLLGRGLCVGLIPPPEQPYRVWCVIMCDRTTSTMRWPWSTAGCRATGGWKQTYHFTWIICIAFTRDRHPCTRRDSNTKSLQVSGHRPTRVETCRGKNTRQNYRL